MTTHLHLLVLPLQLPAQLLQLLLHADRLTQLRPALILLLLQQIGSLLVLGMVSIESSHVGQQFGVAFLHRVQSRQGRLDVGQQVRQISIGLLDFALDLGLLILLPRPITLELGNLGGQQFGGLGRVGRLLGLGLLVIGGGRHGGLRGERRYSRFGM